MKFTTLVVLGCLSVGLYAGAMEKPPEATRNQRSWLSGRVLSDITATDKWMPGTFAKDYSRAKALTNSHANSSYKVSDEEVARLAEYDYLTRTRAEEDLRQFQRQLAMQGPLQGQLPNPQPAGLSDVEAKAAKDDRDAIAALGGELADKSDAAKGLSQLIYASLPGFCLRQSQMLPGSYFNRCQGNDTLHYVGPADDTGYAGPYAAPIDNSINIVAVRRAPWLRHVYRWHDNEKPFAHVPGTGSGNMAGGPGVNPTHNGPGTVTGGRNIRPATAPPPSPYPIGTGTTSAKRNGRSQ